MNASVMTPKDDLKKSEGARLDKQVSGTLDRKVLMKGLNSDLAGEYQAILMYIHYSARPREMLEQALTAEREAIAGYTVRIRQAEAFGDIGLKVNLENQLADETRHKEEIERILDGWNEPNFEESEREIDRWQNDGGQG